MPFSSNDAGRLPRLVLDTNAWLDLLLFADPVIAPLRSWAMASRLQLVSCAETRGEWLRVLDYSQLSLTPERQQSLLASYDALALPVSSPTDASAAEGGIVLPRCGDPDDQIFLTLALHSGADALLTRDKALLVLDARCHRRAGFRVQRPDAWLASTTLALP